MKIALFGDGPTYPSGFGGQIKLLAEGFTKYGHEVFCIAGNGETNEKEDRWKEYIANYAELAILEAYLTRIKPDVLIALGTPIFPVLQKFVTNSKASLAMGHFLWLAWEMSVVPSHYGHIFSHMGQSRVVHLSQFANDLWEPFLGSQPVIPHGVDLEVFKPLDNKQWLRKQWSRRLKRYIPEKEPVFLVVDRNHERKRMDLVFDIISRLRQQRFPATLIIHCERNVENLGGFNLDALTQLYGIEDDVIFTGFDWKKGLSPQELNELYNLADFRISMSGGEGFGIPSVEAMAAGCVNIVSWNTTFPEIVGNAGVLVDCPNRSVVLKQQLYCEANVEEAVQKIIDLMNGKDFLALRDRGFERAKRYDARNVADSWIELITKVETKQEKATKHVTKENGLVGGYNHRAYHLAMFCGKLLEKGKRLIDLGSGKGTFIEACIRMNIPVEGFEKDVRYQEVQSPTVKTFCKIADFRGWKFAEDCGVVVLYNVLHELTDDEIRILLKEGLQDVRFVIVRVDCDPVNFDKRRINIKTHFGWESLIKECGYHGRQDLNEMLPHGDSELLQDVWILERNSFSAENIPAWIVE